MDADSVMEVMQSLWVVWMLAIFGGILAFAYWPRNRAGFERAALIPFQDEGQEK
ncbi:MAG: cbb3-type cytochrome c oxidase subunit 3 [Azospirillaceae bacterium]|nr:cbb3-type cytochrome c oxidase subunit 3 [Azospirillaceae bacterium]